MIIKCLKKVKKYLSDQFYHTPLNYSVIKKR